MTLILYFLFITTTAGNKTGNTLKLTLLNLEIMSSIVKMEAEA